MSGGGSMPNEVEQKVAGVQGVSSAKVEITFEPAWDRSDDERGGAVGIGIHVNIDCGKRSR
jgi:hypothetical protein